MSDLMRAKPIPEISYLHECFIYDPVNGFLIWRTRPQSHFDTKRGMNISNSSHAGNKIECNDRGYLKVRINGQNYFSHQIIFAMEYGRWASTIDHIDGNGLNNRINNIREVSASENQKNSSRRRGAKTLLMGVSWHKGIEKWVAYIGASGALERLGSHSCFFEAVCRRKSAEIRHNFHENHGRPIRAAGVKYK